MSDGSSARCGGFPKRVTSPDVATGVRGFCALRKIGDVEQRSRCRTDHRDDRRVPPDVPHRRPHHCRDVDAAQLDRAAVDTTGVVDGGYSSGCSHPTSAGPDSSITPTTSGIACDHVVRMNNAGTEATKTQTATDGASVAFPSIVRGSAIASRRDPRRFDHRPRATLANDEDSRRRPTSASSSLTA
jgi:hypothetical protein